MPSDIEAYLDARLTYEEARKAIEKIADDVAIVGNALKRDPARFSFSNTGLELPKEAFSGQAFPAEEWPSAERVQGLLQNLHAARIVLRSTWATIPPKLKSGLQPPPAGVLPPQKFERKDD